MTDPDVRLAIGMDHFVADPRATLDSEVVQELVNEHLIGLGLPQVPIYFVDDQMALGVPVSPSWRMHTMHLRHDLRTNGLPHGVAKLLHMDGEAWQPLHQLIMHHIYPIGLSTSGQNFYVYDAGNA